MLLLTSDGPGVDVEVLDGQQGLPVAPRGVGAIFGTFPSGPTTKAALALTPNQARLFVGDPDDDFEGVLALDDVYSEYAPPMLLARVTDGNDVKAQGFLWDRAPSRSFLRNNGTVVADRAPLATVTAHNGGRWGGRKRVMVGTLNAVATDVLTTSTVDLGTSTEIGSSMLVNLLAGATLYFEGDTGGPYEIISNDADGVATIKGTFSDDVYYATGSGAVDGDVRIVLGHDKELAVVVGQDQEIGERFSIYASRKFSVNGKWEEVTRYDGLQLLSTDERPWVSTITEGEDSRYQIALSTSYAGATVEDYFPANICECPTDVTDNVVTVQWYRWAISAGPGTGYVRAVAAVSATDIVPHVYVLTFTAATTFTIAVTWPDGTSQSLGSGSTGTPFAPSHPQLAGFLVTAGTTAFTSATRIVIRVSPLPLDLYQRDAWLYPIAHSDDGNAMQRYRIIANTYNTVTVRSDIDLAAAGAAAGTGPIVTGTDDLTAITVTSGTTVILTPSSGDAVTLTFATTPTGAANIAAALTALDSASQFVFGVDSATSTKLTIQLNAKSYGALATLAIGNGTANSDLGLTNGDTDNGTDAIPFRIEAKMPMWGGYDGVAPTGTRYSLAADQDAGVLECYRNYNLGLITVASPGLTASISNGAAAKTDLQSLCEANGWKYIAEFASSLESGSTPGEDAVASLTANETESDHVIRAFPSRGKFSNVAKTGIVTRSLAGMWLGIRARLANEGADGERGFQIAAANNNIQGRLSPRVKGLSDDIGRWTPPVRLMNDYGIVPVLWEGPNVYFYGNRMYSAGRTPAGKRYTITERSVYYHVARDLFITTRPYVFKTISARRLGEVQSGIRDKMRVYFEDGWFSDEGGLAPGFEQQVVVEVPLRLNPPENLREGNVHASVMFTPRPSIEKLLITIAPNQFTAG